MTSLLQWGFPMQSFPACYRGEECDSMGGWVGKVLFNISEKMFCGHSYIIM